MFGEERIKQILDANKHKTPDEILTEFEKAVAAHVHPGSAADDINMVLIQYPAEG